MSGERVGCGRGKFELKLPPLVLATLSPHHLGHLATFYILCVTLVRASVVSPPRALTHLKPLYVITLISSKLKHIE